MKAIRVHSSGGPEVMRYEQISDPEPGAGEALVRIEASGVNYIDVYHRSGVYKALFPLTLGQEGAGTVVRIGAGVTEVRDRDRVAFVGVMGSYAEYAAVPAARLVLLPKDVSATQAAAVLLQGMTAHYLACSTYPLKPGDTCLVHAAAGGVGLLLCQIAKSRGARVIATVSSDEKAKRAREAGADETIDYAKQDFESEVRRITNGRGVEVVYDSVGKSTFQRGFNCLARRGMMVLYGQSSGPVDPIDPQMLNEKGSVYLTRPSLSHYIAAREDLIASAREVFDGIREGRLKLRVFREMPLGEAAEAHRLLESRKTAGKLLLIP